MIHIVPTEEWHLWAVGENVRDCDASELEMFIGGPPVRALYFIKDHAQSMHTVLLDGKPLVVFGHNVTDLLFKVAAPFMIATKEAEAHPVVMARVSKRVIEAIKGYYLVNFVQADNEWAIRWLKWLGFYVAEPENYRDVAMIRRFSKDCR